MICSASLWEALHLHLFFHDSPGKRDCHKHVSSRKILCFYATSHHHLPYNQSTNCNPLDKSVPWLVFVFPVNWELLPAFVKNCRYHHTQRKNGLLCNSDFVRVACKYYLAFYRKHLSTCLDSQGNLRYNYNLLTK